MRKHRQPKTDQKRRCVGVIDSETDPFDNQSKSQIMPFLFVIYTREREPIVIWDENFSNLKKRLLAALDSFDESYTWYAHNGGKFDYMFLISELRGEVSFKGRGIMSAKIGRHEIRDSFHIIPERLANLEKESFDYFKLKRERRAQYRTQIIDYCISDCRNLLKYVDAFVEDFGLKISIGQAASAEMRKHYTWAKLTPGWDQFLRQFYFGGRVECIEGRGHFEAGDYYLVDLNSAYPDAMAHLRHPIGGMADYDVRMGKPGRHTVFIDLECENNGALIMRTETGETSARVPRGNFMTTIWEYRVALKHKLISDVRINYCYDCRKRTDFSKFVLPRYARRTLTKKMLADMKSCGREGSPEFFVTKKDDLFEKLLLNNGYGRLAINPRNFKEHYITDPGEQPPPAWMKSIARLSDSEQAEYLGPLYEGEAYWIWTKPSPGFSFQNVGTAASIAGAVRAKLLDALCTVKGAIYCDTDSIICTDYSGLEIDKEKLGAWDLEDTFKSVVIAGKKLYAREFKTPKRGADGQISTYDVKSKGTAGLTWEQMRALLPADADGIDVLNAGPTLTKFSEQSYIVRRIRATAPLVSSKPVEGDGGIFGERRP